MACLFNFSDQAVSVALPPSMTINAVSGHGFAGRIDGRSVSLAGGDAFFGTVG